MKLFLIILTFFISTAGYSFAGQPSFIGILEQRQTCDNSEVPFSARVLFSKEKRNWNALGVSGSNKPSTNWAIESIEWSITLKGEMVGMVSLQDPTSSVSYVNDWYYRRDKHHKVKDHDKILLIPNTKQNYSGWCSTPTKRPLILVSGTNFKNPEEWESFKVEKSVKNKLFPYLKVAVGRFKSIRCKYEPTYHSVPYDFKPQDTVIHESYKNSAGTQLISIGLNLEAINCDGPPEPEWKNNWFLIHGPNVEFLGQELELIDSGDYDNDGTSEFIFWHSGYNEDGYVIMFNNFEKKSEYFWGYH